MKIFSYCSNHRIRQHPISKAIPIKKSPISPALKQEKALQIGSPPGIKITVYQRCLDEIL